MTKMYFKEALGIGAVLIALLGVAAPAHACELICVQTTQAYDGNLGGLAGADAKCAAEFPGFRFMRTPMNVLQVAGGTAGSYGGSGQIPAAWTNEKTNNCGNWTSNSSGYGTTIAAFLNSSASYSEARPNQWCSSPTPLWCCNM